MIPKAKDLRKYPFEWPESRFERCSFHRDEDQGAMVELLASDRAPAVAVLAGDRGCGRRDFCEAAGHRASQDGRRVAVWHLDLDGFEPEGEQPLADFQKHLLDEHEQEMAAAEARCRAGDAARSAATALNPAGLAGRATDWAAMLLSLCWQFEELLEGFAEILSTPARAGGVPQRDDPQTLRRCLEELTRERKLLVHVEDSPQLTSELRRWLIGEAEDAPDRLSLAISCGLHESVKKVAPSAEHTPVLFDLAPLEPGELHRLLDRRLAPNALPDELVAALHRHSRGRSMWIANQVADLMATGALDADAGGVWTLPPEGMEHSSLVAAFSRDLHDEVDRRIAEAGDLGDTLRKFLALAALCGRYVPPGPLLAYLGLDEDTAEAVIDFLDDVLEAEIGWLRDLGFRHPAFRGLNVYVFTHPLLPRVLLDQLPEAEREMQAITLLRFLEQRTRLQSRGTVRFLLAIAEHLGDREREPYERQLEWWIGPGEAEALIAEVKAAIERQELDPDLVWQRVSEAESWPPFRRLALLDAYAETVIEQQGDEESTSRERLGAFHLLRSRLRQAAGRYPEGLEDALQALPLVESDPLLHGAALNLCGAARLELGLAEDAWKDLEAALENMQSTLGPEHPSTLTIRQNLAEALRARGDHAAARRLQEQALESWRRILGPGHPTTLTSQHNLAATLLALGDVAQARDAEQQALEGLRHSLGPNHPTTRLVAVKLAGILRELGETESADASSPVSAGGSGSRSHSSK